MSPVTQIRFVPGRGRSSPPWAGSLFQFAGQVPITYVMCAMVRELGGERVHGGELWTLA
jgi:hypothetical protein